MAAALGARLNYRTTIALIAILALVLGLGYVYTNSRASRGPEKVRLPQEQFYLVDLEDIQKVEVAYRGKVEKFVKDPDHKWYFDTAARERVNLDRWGGITLLISGPRFERVIADQATDLARYGLQDPPLIVKADLVSLGKVTIRVGDKTPDGQSSYALFQEERAVHLIASDWGDVIGRLVTEPPHIPPTPVGATPNAGGDPAAP